jgi:hypothetical protein
MLSAKRVHSAELDMYLTTNFFAAIFSPASPLTDEEMERWHAYLLRDEKMRWLAGAIFHVLESKADDEASNWRFVREHLSESTWNPKMAQNPEARAKHLLLLDSITWNTWNKDPQTEISGPRIDRPRRGRDAFDHLRRRGRWIEAERKRWVIEEDKRDRNRLGVALS